jgi:hypothetical protein
VMEQYFRVLVIRRAAVFWSMTMKYSNANRLCKRKSKSARIEPIIHGYWSGSEVIK